MRGIREPDSNRDTKIEISPPFSHSRHRSRYTVILLVISPLIVFCVWNGRWADQRGRGLKFLRPWSSIPCGIQPEKNNKISFAELEMILQNEPTASKISKWSSYYTSTTYLPGDGKEQGVWTKNKWQEFGIPETWITEHDVTVGDPLHQSLSLIAAPGNSTTKILFEADLTEAIPQDDPSTTRTPAYTYSSASGNLTAQFIYANFGLSNDYDDLEKAGVDIKGKIAVVKYGQAFRQKKVETAAQRGLVGIILYTDPQQDGKVTESHGFKPYPDGPARPPSYIERGTANDRSKLICSGMCIAFLANSHFTYLPLRGSNPAIPGKAIPAIPVSSKDITPILLALNGYGPKASDINKRWLGGELEFRGVHYYAGPSPPEMLLSLNNQINYRDARAYNVLGMISGTMKDDNDVILIGNHRDAWSGGTTDPHSGSAALMEVVRSFGVAVRAGWRPQRTIVFGSWDAAEVGLVGSRGWVTENLPWLSKSAVAYLNVVIAAAGTKFRAKATPLLHQVLRDAAKSVNSPFQHVDGKVTTVFDEWDGDILGAGGGDTIPFLQTACISTTDMGFFPGTEDAPYPYHSNFDTQAWMNTCDPEWKYHLSTAKIWSLMALQLAESPVLEMNSLDYAIQLKKYVEFAKLELSRDRNFDLQPLEEAVASFYTASSMLDEYASNLKRTIAHKTGGISHEISQVNLKYKEIERQFCYHGTSDESEHVIFGSSTFYLGGNILPRLINSLKSGNWSDALKWRNIIQKKIESATAVIEL